MKAVEFLHKTRDGRKIPLREMGDIHLLNTLSLISNKAKAAITVRRGGGGSPEDFWYDEERLTGKDALEYLSYDRYLAEAKRRNLL